MTLEYKQSLSELNMIFSYMDEEYISKIPEKIIDFIKVNMDSTYIPQIDRNTPINEQKIKKDTKTLLSVFYRYYWCDDETRKRLLEEDKKELVEYRKELEHSYNLEEVLRKKRNIQQNEEVVKPVENIQMVSYEKPKWYKKIFERIIHLIKK